MFNTEQLQMAGDTVSISIVITSLAGWLPAISAVLAIIWTGIRIYETDTIQKWLNKKKDK